MRFRMRTPMIVVALAAVALVTPGEVRSRRERRHLARLGVFYLRGATIHDRHRAVCDARDGGRPYERLEREWALMGHDSGRPRPDGWAEEATWHADKAAEFRDAAADVA